MNFSQLQSFISVVRLHSFSEAAKQLHFSQSTITTHISELEKELEQQLLIRTTRDFKLTKAGMSLYSFAVAVVSRRDALISDINKDKITKKVLRIVTSSLPLHCYLPPILAEYNKEFPNVFLKLIPSDSRTIIESMDEHQAHLAFCGYDYKNKDCSCIPLIRDKLVVITPNTEEYRCLDQHLEYPYERLMKEAMISRAPTSGTRIEFEKGLRSMGIYDKPNIIAEMPDVFSIVQCVSLGMGIAVVPLSEMEQGNYLDKICCFPLSEHMDRSICIVKKKQDKIFDFEKEFYNYVLNRNRVINQAIY